MTEVKKELKLFAVSQCCVYLRDPDDPETGEPYHRATSIYAKDSETAKLLMEIDILEDCPLDLGFKHHSVTVSECYGIRKIVEAEGFTNVFIVELVNATGLEN